MESWSIEVHKDYLKFSAAHFLIFPDGTAERLHGHNYKVYVGVHANLDDHGLVLNFKEIKPLIRELVDELDEALLIPSRHPVLTTESLPGGQLEIRYKQRRYQVPADEVRLLPINNTSAENLAGYLAHQLLERVRRDFAASALQRLEVGVEETPGQRGVVTIEFGTESGGAARPGTP
ncbi:MAG: 6-carboxytetrahydropterin synthase [Planctomycetes bacterium]|nr:6-carboxytetrahydropterin synthase [Planctomycetota bacterium]MCB9869154.1 6-carboxytetrahydropterin synthase [Planctomycetota bacterium]